MSARTTDEIVARIKSPESEDFLGTQRGDLIFALPFDVAKRNGFLTDETTEDDWEQTTDPAASLRDYLPFAIEKCRGHRGLSASRSVAHVAAWTWLMGDEAHEQVMAEDFQNYGAPILRAAAELVGVEWPDDPDLNRMADGFACQPDGCPEGGCGS